MAELLHFFSCLFLYSSLFEAAERNDRLVSHFLVSRYFRPLDLVRRMFPARVLQRRFAYVTYTEICKYARGQVGATIDYRKRFLS